MQRSDLSPDRSARLVPVPGKSGAFALNPPFIDDPADLVLGSRMAYSGRARETLAELQAALAALPDPDIALRTLSRREAVRSGQIEGAQAQVADVLAYPERRKTLPFMAGI